MDIGFALPLGPLNQVSVQVIHPTTALQLATGALGWWRARPRSQSLLQVIDSSGGTLSAPSTFNVRAYKFQREKESLRGVSLRTQPGTLAPVALPAASTAIEGDPGMVCLRALVTALLCFFPVAATTKIMIEILPFMVNLHQEGKPIPREGPLLSAFKEYVEAVSVEEENNSLRQLLLGRFEAQKVRVSGASLEEITISDSIGCIDAPLIVGMLEWVLTPKHRRVVGSYPTRSLQVWGIVFLLSELGFEVVAGMNAISTVEAYQLYVTNLNESWAGVPEVQLVLKSVGATDQLSNLQGMRPINEPLQPRITTIRGIPFIGFRHLPRYSDQILIDDLSDIWQSAFENSYKIFHAATNPRSCRPRSNPNPKVKRLIATWDEGLAWLVSDTVEQAHGIDLETIDLEEASHWLPSFRNRYVDKVQVYVVRLGDGWTDIWHILTAIVTASIYAVACCFLRQNNKVCDLDTEIAFPPDFFYGPLPYYWARRIASLFCYNRREGLVHQPIQPSNGKLPLGGRWLITPDPTVYSNSRDAIPDWSPEGEFLSAAMERERVHRINSAAFQGWKQLLLSMVTGTDSEEDESTELAVGKMGYKTVFGCQFNGMAILSEFLTKPTLTNPSLLFHIQCGHFLDVPIASDGMVRASFIKSAGQIGYDFEDSSPRPTLSIPHVDAESPVRLDLEPDWELDPRKVVFRLRQDGVVKGTISPLSLLSTAAETEFVPCSCPSPVKSIEFTDEKPPDACNSTLSELLKTFHPPDTILLANGTGNCGLFVIHAGDTLQSEAGLAATALFLSEDVIFMEGEYLSCIWRLVKDENTYLEKLLEKDKVLGSPYRNIHSITRNDLPNRVIISF